MIKNHSEFRNGIYIPPKCKTWPHELHVAEILAAAGHKIEFLNEEISLQTADILLDGVEFEIKSPISSKTNSLEQLLKKALKQAPNIIIYTGRMKNSRDNNTCKFLVSWAKTHKQARKVIMITKRDKIIDISSLI